MEEKTRLKVKLIEEQLQKALEAHDAEKKTLITEI